MAKIRNNIIPANARKIYNSENFYNIQFIVSIDRLIRNQYGITKETQHKNLSFYNSPLCMTPQRIDRMVVNELSRAANYSHAVTVNDVIFLSGITGQSTKETSFDEQFDLILEKLKIVLSNARSSIGHIVKITAYLLDEQFFENFNEKYNKTFTSLPARTTIVCKFINKFTKLELDVIAIKG
jgi:2-iminobutanoate/2-iminopropanoate deaminase